MKTFLGLILLVPEQFNEKCLTNHSAEDRYASYSPDGSQIVFESNRNGNWDIFIMNPSGDGVKQLTEGPGNYRRPYWNPSGSSVIYESVDKNELMEIDLSNNSTSVILSVKELSVNGIFGKIQFPRYSPKEQKFSFTLVENDTLMNIFIYDREKETIEEVFVNPYRTVYASWGTKGNRIVFHSRHDTENKTDEIYEINLRDKSIRRLTNWPQHNFCPSYSPKDKYIVYSVSQVDNRPEIFIMKRDGSDQKQITFNSDGDTLPAWSPDGQKLLVTAYRNGNYEICEIDVSGLD